MDLGIAAAASVTAKKSRVSTGSATEGNDEQLKALLHLLAKMCLSAHQQLRVHNALLLNVVRVSSRGRVHELAREHIDAYVKAAEQIKDQELKEATLGFPHHHVLNAILKVIQELGNPEEQEKATTYVRLMGDKSKEERFEILAENFKYIKFHKAWKKEHKKMIWNVKRDTQEAEIMTTLLNILKRTDKHFKKMCGTAPKGALERKVQEYLEKGTVELEDGTAVIEE